MKEIRDEYGQVVKKVEEKQEKSSGLMGDTSFASGFAVALIVAVLVILSTLIIFRVLR